MYGIPTFEPGAMFTYFVDLLNTKKNSLIVKKLKRDLFSSASNYANSAATALETDMKDEVAINNSLNFLLSVA